MTPSCVLFDLDGTLINTAPDLIKALNQTLIQFDYPTVADKDLKPFISYGAAAMLDHAITETISESRREQLLAWLLNYYEHHLADLSHLYEGMAEILQMLKTQNIPWGIVTNKRERFALPLMQALNLTQQTDCIICGDTTAHSKPHPEPMLAACQKLTVDPLECLYIGDAQHDITAGNSVDMTTIVACYGYLTTDAQPETWQADAMINHPSELLNWISPTCH